MNTYEINALLGGRVSGFLGTFPCDKLPLELPASRPLSLVLNTDISTERGSHWQAIVIPNRKTVYFFDSFGRRPRGKHVMRWLRHHDFRRVVYSEARSQLADETTCGAYCVYVIMRMCRRRASFSQIVRQFRCMRNDDRFVRRYMRRVFSYEVPPQRVGPLIPSSFKP